MFRLLWLALFGCIFIGCLSAHQHADRAYEAGDYDTALQHYDVAIQEGSRDPELFHRAAIAAMSVGSFASAERYFSQALRYGGDIEVTRDLAQFYIRTSNYAQAVRVFQYLLNQESNPQPVYNNLGTALMYAEMPFDAETYLLMAQQLDPNDPVPYINLGLLYDRHFKQPMASLGFYKCYLQMTTDRSQARTVQMRVDEIQARVLPMVEGFDVVCGEPFQIAPVSAGRIRSELGSSSSATGEAASRNGEIIDLGLKEDEVDGPVEIIVREERQEGGTKHSGEEAVAGQPASAASERARKAFDEGRYDEVVSELKARAAGLDARGQGMLGISLLKIGQFSEAHPMLESALQKRPAPEVAAALFEVYRRLELEVEQELLCKRFEAWTDFEALIAASCN